MTTTKKITEVQALAITLEVAEGVDVETACASAGFSAEEYTEKIKKMRDVREKKREKDPNAPKTKSKARIENEALAVQAAEAMAAHSGEGVGSKWVMEHVPYITSTQRVTSVMKVANELGLVESTKDEKGRALYLPIV